MGCDIHLYVEGKRSISGSEKWISADYFSINPYYNEFEDEKDQYKLVPLYDDRNYRLFALLAGVRNHSKITPIADLRGTPDDSCLTIIKAKEYWGADAHSSSYFTLAELEEYASKKIKTKYSGYVHESEMDKPLNGECPSSWCQGTNEPGHIHMEWEVEENILEPIITALRNRARELFYCWTDEQVDKFSDKLRIVFWFDN